MADRRQRLTVGLSVPLVASGSLELAGGPGTINIAAVLARPVTDLTPPHADQAVHSQPAASAGS